MEMSDLFSSLKDQHKFLEAFLNTITLQQRAIITNDIAGLEETIKTEGALLIHIDQYEKQMIKIINELSHKYSLDVSSNKLSEFLEKASELKEINTQSIVKIQSSLKTLAMQIAKLNAQNRMLVEQARSFIQETVAAIINSSKNQIFDRKI